MYNRPARRRALIGLAGAHARQMPAKHHSGSVGEFLRRHERDAKQAALGNRSERQKFARRLLQLAGDTRNVKLAIEHCASRGQAAGPNGLKPSDLDVHSRWALARTLGAMIQEGEYHPSAPRTVWIDKGGDRGQRPIRIQNFEDRCVERAILQIIRPITGAQYLDNSMGFRSPGFSREKALATAEHWALTHNQWSWISEDLRDAFEHIPTSRLSQILYRMIPNVEICDFIGNIAFNQNGRGIRQGGPLSPELLNAYLHWGIDRPWQQSFSQTPLFRVADDLLILARPEETTSLYQALHQIAVQIGMPLKGSVLSSIYDLTIGQNVNWLGYQIRRDETGLNVSINQRSWDRLEDHLNLAWETPIPSLTANETIRGWISQQGATYQESTVPDTYRDISQLARVQGFQEIPERREVTLLWSRAYNRDWLEARQAVSRRFLQESMPADGSASQHSESAADSSRGSVASATSSSSQSAPRRREVFLYCDGSCLSPHGVGAWAFLSIDQETGYRQQNGGGVSQTTNNRMELTAVIRGLESLPESSQVHLVLDSRYVMDGITQWLPRWIDQNWRATSRRSHPVANVDLWQSLVNQLDRHHVGCQWVAGHSGHPENEFVDQMARAIAEQFQQQQFTGSSSQPRVEA
ncbi:MAG: RNase H family protein [Planctomycetota bacterium]